MLSPFQREKEGDLLRFSLTDSDGEVGGGGIEMGLKEGWKDDGKDRRLKGEIEREGGKRERENACSRDVPLVLHQTSFKSHQNRFTHSQDILEGVRHYRASMTSLVGTVQIKARLQTPISLMSFT